MIRCAKVAQDRGIGGVDRSRRGLFLQASATQMTDDLAQIAVEEFIQAAE